MNKKIMLSILLTMLLCVTTGCAESKENSEKESVILETDYTGSNSVNHENDIKECTEMVELFGCKAEKIEADITSQQLTELYITAYNECKGRDCTPVIITLDDILQETIDANYARQGTPEDYRKAMLSTDTSNGKEHFETSFKQLEKQYEDDTMGILSQSDEEFESLLSMSMPKNKCLGSVLAAQEQNNGTIYLIYVPTSNPWEVFAWLPFGGWNECPNTSELLSQCRYWYEEYGAIPACISHDMLEFYLFDPVADKEIAKKAAKEHCVFCNDILGMGGINLEAVMIYNSNTWGFWWD